MAFKHGDVASITVNSIDLSTFCNNLSLAITGDVADVTAFGKTYKVSIPGLAGASLTLAGSYDPTASTGPDAVLGALVGAAAFPVIYGPGGTVTGQLKRTFNALLTSFNETSQTTDKVAFTATLLVTDSITFGAY